MDWYHEFFAAIRPPGLGKNKHNKPRWSPPAAETLKSNVDGAFLHNNTEDVIGGILINSQGQPIVGFAHDLTNATSAIQPHKSLVT